MARLVRRERHELDVRVGADDRTDEQRTAVSVEDMERLVLGETDEEPDGVELWSLEGS